MKLQPAFTDTASALSGSAGITAASEQPKARELRNSVLAAAAKPPRSAPLGNERALNAQVTAAQQALGFLDQMASRLQALKQEAGARLAGKPGDPAVLAQRLEAFSAAWARRSRETGASLDSKLGLVAPGAARREFRLRGLDMQALQQGGAETLTFYPAGVGKPAQQVLLDGGMAPEQIVQRFNKGLAAAGISASLGEDGELSLSVAEADWQGLVDNLQLKGDGIRFPGGQAHRVRAESRGDAIEPANWHGNDIAGLRRTLQQVVRAIEQVEQARERVKLALERANRMIEEARASGAAEWAQSFSGDFNQLLQQGGGYALLSSVAPALIGISRYRVVSLLAL
ncbi:hypothetical protein [Vogesella oryzae]|uniref:hypothetical protein n=1 Tax=Vogesella oryzae TaxID=1735285 RepID=UPI001582451C|nr:hypothetical protein [Vogesella oryzae]